MSMLMALSKKGRFQLMVAAQSNPGRCGSETNRVYDYELTVEIPSAQLDKDDFVTDHLSIQKFFEDTFGKEPWILSCEMIAARTVIHFYEKLKAQEIYKIDVNIIADGVSHQCHWEANYGAPKMPPVKSQFANIGKNWANPANAPVLSTNI